MHIITNPADDAVHKPFHGILQRWFSMKRDDALPDAETFLNIVDELDTFRMVAHVSHDPLSIQYTSVGETLERLYGSPIAGKNLDQLYNDWFRKRAYEGYRMTIESKSPVYEHRTFSVLIRKLGYYKIHLPFGPDPIVSIITYIMPIDTRIKKRTHWEKIVRKTPWLSG